MEVIAVAESETCWRWEIRHRGAVVKTSAERFETTRDAIEAGKRRRLTLWTGEDRPFDQSSSSGSPGWPRGA